MKNARRLYLGILAVVAVALLVMAGFTATSTTESGGADIRAPMFALIAGAMMCLSFAPFQPEILRVPERALAAMLATGSGWFWLVGPTGAHWSTLKGLGLFVALAATIVILLLVAIISTVTAIRNCIKSRHH